MQYPIQWAGKEANLLAAHSHIQQVSGKADVAIFPEMFTTGFCTQQPELAETMEGKTIQCLKQWAKENDMAIIGSFICTDHGKLYNRAVFVAPNGAIYTYDKRHLYAHGGEADFFTRGTNRLVVEYLGVRMCILLCYDLRFPAWSRNQHGDDYDVLIYCANWPIDRIQMWDTLLPARAIENQSLIIGVNPVGTDGLGLYYPGHSVAIDTRLQRQELPADQEGTLLANLDINALHHFREALPLWKDVDLFTIH